MLTYKPYFGLYPGYGPILIASLIAYILYVVLCSSCLFFHSCILHNYSYVKGGVPSLCDLRDHNKLFLVFQTLLVVTLRGTLLPLLKRKITGSMRGLFCFLLIGLKLLSFLLLKLIRILRFSYSMYVLNVI